MKKVLYAFLAAAMAAFHMPAFAQDGILPDYGEIGIFSDTVSDGGSRLISADSFRIGRENGAVAYLSLHVLLDPGKWADFSNGLWYANVDVKYDGDSYLGRETGLPFNGKDILVIRDYHTGDTLRLNLMHVYEDTGNGWHGAAFCFGYEEFRDFVMRCSPCQLTFTQGAGNGTTLCVGFQCVGLDVALLDSVLAILNAMQEGHGK